MKLFVFLLRSSWQVVVLAAALGALSGGASVGLIAVIHRALNNPGQRGQLALWFAGLCVLVLVTRILSQMLLVRLSQKTMSRLTLHLCEQALAAPLAKLEEIGEHRIVASLTHDVAVVSQALNQVPAICTAVVTLTCGLVYLGWLSSSLLVAVLGFLLLGIGSYLTAARFARKHIRQGRDELDSLMKVIRSLVRGIKELKMHAPRREAMVREVLEPTDASVRDEQIKGFSIQAAAVSWGRLMFFVGLGVLLFVWPRFQPIDAATLTGYALTILYLMNPMERLLGWLPAVNRAQVSLTKIKRLGLALDATAPEARAKRIPDSFERIDLQDIVYTYQRAVGEESFKLGPVQLSIVPGEVLMIVGGNGSGKTTLLKLLTGLYKSQSGRLVLDGQVVTDDELESYRQLFSAIFAEVALFDSLLGIDPRRSEQHAARYLAELQLDKEVSITAGQLSTTEALSKGQRKRLALVAAYLEDRPVYVFDEWAADQDPIYKNIFYTEIINDLKAQGKAVVVVSHDDRFFQVADRIVVLRDGKILTGEESSIWSAFRRSSQPDAEVAPN